MLCAILWAYFKFVGRKPFTNTRMPQNGRQIYLQSHIWTKSFSLLGALESVFVFAYFQKVRESCIWEDGLSVLRVLFLFRDTEGFSLSLVI